MPRALPLLRRRLRRTRAALRPADALSDCARAAHGALRCLGTSLHLKTKYGVGYKLELALDAHAPAPAAARAFAEAAACAPATLLKQAGGVLTLQLDERVPLAELVRAMEARPTSAGIAHFALRQTSMEEVFLSIAMATEEELVAGRARAADEVGKAGTAGTCTAGPIEVAEA